MNRFQYYDCFRCDNDGLPLERMALVWDDESRRRKGRENAHAVGEGICLQCGREAIAGEASGLF